MDNKTQITPPEERLAFLARVFAKTSSDMVDIAQRADKEIGKIKRSVTPVLRRRLQDYDAARTEMIALIKANPGMFKKPKTRVLEGVVKVGLRKQPGKTVLPKATEALLQKLKKGYPKLKKILIKVTESPIKDALAKHLSAKQLKSLGIEVKDATDVPVVAIVEGDVEALVRELTKDGD